MTQVTIYHNTRCSTSRKVLQALRDAGIEPVIVEYLKTPLGHDELVALLERLQITSRELLRTKEDEYKVLGLDDESLSDESLIQAVAEHPRLMQRPIVVVQDAPTGDWARICRPPEVIGKWLQSVSR